MKTSFALITFSDIPSFRSPSEESMHAIGTEDSRIMAAFFIIHEIFQDS